MQKQWTAVDRYLVDLLVPTDQALDEALRSSERAGLPALNVAPNQGKFLQILTQIQGARRILEIGTLGGYSTIWMARALPKDGRLITLEFEPKHAEVARGNIARANLSDRVDIRVGKAVDSLAALVQAGEAPFDLIFIDADKPSNPEYLQWSLKLSRPGTLIIGDNVVRDGQVVDPNNQDPKIVGTRRFLEMLGELPQLTVTAIQTVGSKGYDGFAIARVN
jgi:predicted O-methyltransferase YrrM